MAPPHIRRITVLVLALVIASAVGVSGHCTKPRVRREWRSISAEERSCWINAIKCLAKLPQNPEVVGTVDPAISMIPPKSSNTSYFDDFSYAHMDLNALIHGTGFFLPWHRLFVQTFEDVLRSKCGYTGVHPYWDWTQDTADFYHATIFSDSTFDGLGGWGDPNNDYQISTGGFKDIMVAYPGPVPRHIRRHFSILIPGPLPPGVPPLALNINDTFTSKVTNFVVSSSTGNFSSFQANLQGFDGPHPGPHFILGGDMAGNCPFGLAPPICNPGPKWSPNDPMFYLHHATIDKVWYDWQRRDPRNKNVFEGGSTGFLADPNLSPTEYPSGGPPWLNKSSVIPGDGLWKHVRVKDVMDTVGGRLCYVYE